MNSPSPHQPTAVVPQLSREPILPAMAPSTAPTAENQVPLLETNLRVMQLLETYVKVTWLPELEKKVKQLKNHSDEARRLEEKDVSVRRREEESAIEHARLVTEKETLETLRKKLEEDTKVSAAKKIETDQLEKILQNTVTMVTTGANATMPTVFRGEFPTANAREWIDVNAAQALGIRLHVSLQMLGIAEDIKSKELFLTVGAECYRLVQDIDKALGSDSTMTKKLAETLSQQNVFDYRFRIPLKGQPLEPQWMAGPAGIVNTVECWAILDQTSNGKKALVK